MKVPGGVPDDFMACVVQCDHLKKSLPWTTNDWLPRTRTEREVPYVYSYRRTLVGRTAQK